ncbi:MAG: hypothetical protein EBS05_12860 [Proteobacteria bacterium]|nr:hypothetical protein [Pseudomonadota bacterium]NDF01314.1 hypothetical protein [Verrucomicrobiota bacterium]
MKEIIITVAGMVALFAIPPLAGRIGGALAKRRAASAKQSNTTQLDGMATPHEIKHGKPSPTQLRRI